MYNTIITGKEHLQEIKKNNNSVLTVLNTFCLNKKDINIQVIGKHTNQERHSQL